MDTGLHDAFGRRIDYIRLSLTDRCNFRCIYCMPSEGLPFISHEEIITYEELLRLVAIFASLGIAHYKVTGGEPLCRKGIVDFIRGLVRVPGVEDVTLTSNGSVIEPHLEDLAASGVRQITFSCDAFSQEAFGKICRTDTRPEQIRQAMERAAALGMQVKINMVPLQGYNDEEILPLARFALERGYHIRFIEYMPGGKDAHRLRGIPQPEVLEVLEREFGPLAPVGRKTGNGPALVYSVESCPGYIGFIAAVSRCFCRTCNRVRLTSTGFLKTCLCHDEGADLKSVMADGADDIALRRIIEETVFHKPARHMLSLAPSAKETFLMSRVGG